MKSPIVSICVTSFNHRPYIRECIQSAINQTFADWELVLLDDGSTDQTLDAIADLSDRRLRIEASPRNLTRSVALNACISRAQGEFIAILNSDDQWHPRKLELQLEVFRRAEIGACFTWVDVVNEVGSYIGPAENFKQRNSSSRDWLGFLLSQGKTPFCHSSAMVRRDIYDRVGVYDERFSVLLDYEQWLRVSEVSEVYVLPQELTVERLQSDGSNASGNRPDVHIRMAWERALAIHKALQRGSNRFVEVLEDLLQLDHHPGSGADHFLISGQSELASRFLAMSPDQITQLKMKLQAVRFAVALFVSQSLSARASEVAAPGALVRYRSLVSGVDPLGFADVIDLQNSLYEVKRENSRLQMQLTMIRGSKAWRLLEALRRLLRYLWYPVT